MKENSPICARLRPTITETRSGYFSAWPTPTTVIAFTAITASTSARSQWRLYMKNLKSRSIPMDMKKRLEKVSLKGMTSATIWLEYSDSEMARPAINAPRASERPKSEVTHAVPRHTSTMVRMKTSRFLSFTTWSNILGMSQMTAMTMTAKAAKEKPSFPAMSMAEESPFMPMDCMIMTISTTARSWNMRTPTERLPCGELTSPLSTRSFNTMAVEEREMTKPRSMATEKDWPMTREMPSTMRTVKPTWKPPPRMPSFLILRSLDTENSRPMVKRRSTTPI